MDMTSVLMPHTNARPLQAASDLLRQGGQASHSVGLQGLLGSAEFIPPFVFPLPTPAAADTGCFSLCCDGGWGEVLGSGCYFVHSVSKSRSHLPGGSLRPGKQSRLNPLAQSSRPLRPALPPTHSPSHTGPLLSLENAWPTPQGPALERPPWNALAHISSWQGGAGGGCPSHTLFKCHFPEGWPPDTSHKQILHITRGVLEPSPSVPFLLSVHIGYTF